VSNAKHIHILEGMIASRCYTDDANQAFRAAVVALGGSASAACCAHENTRASHDYVGCLDCGAIKVDSGWGVAAGLWFKDREQAKFYKQNGRLPEPLP
jgi:hypothetical protein